MTYDLKPKFAEKMKSLLQNDQDFQEFNKIIHIKPRNYIRCNTLKISCEDLFARLKVKWPIIQPFNTIPEIMLIKSDLEPGALGSSIEHQLGFYYIQEISSMMSALALLPESEELVFDLCASPGSKTTQMAGLMKNKGTIIANDLKMDRIMILSANMERCGVTNTIVTRNDSVSLCTRLSEKNIKADKILLDAPCSGEGTLRSSAKTFIMWNPKVVDNLSRQQKKLFAHAPKALKSGGSIVYSTCTHPPEENESVIQFALDNFPVKLESISLPLKTRPGLLQWKDDVFHSDMVKCCRIYPQDNDSEGFFVAKLTLLENIK